MFKSGMFKCEECYMQLESATTPHDLDDCLDYLRERVAVLESSLNRKHNNCRLRASLFSGKRSNTMDENVRSHVAQYCKKKGWATDDATIIEAITDIYPYLHREGVGNHRWWNDYFYVIEIDGMFIGYYDAETTGDMSAYESGFEFGSSSIHEVKAVEKTVIVYEPVDN